MKSYYFFILLMVGSSLNLISQERSNTFIYFDVDAYELDRTSRTEIQELFAKLEKHSDYKIEIIGHTDQDGSTAYNNVLAQKRAEKVYDYLINLGNPSEQVSRDSKGESELYANDNTDESKQKNRRVELKASYWDYDSVEDLTKQIAESKEPQIFICDSKPQLYDLANGSSVYIPSNAFEYQDGSPVSGEVKIEIIEAFSFTDIIANNLYTESKGALLETGGMMYVNAKANGEQIQLKDDKRIELIFPVQKEEKGMELFYGEESDGGITWNATGEDLSTTQVKNKPLEIDLQPIIDFDFGEIRKPKLQFLDLPARPRLMKQPYPPSDKLYSGEKYKALYNKYLAKLELYKNDIPRYQAAETKWQGEVTMRISAIEDFKSEIAEFQYKIKMVNAVRGLSRMENRRAPAELLGRMFSFMNKPYTIKMDHRDLYKKAFGNYTRDIVHERKLEVFQEEHLAFVRSNFFPDLKAIVFDAQRLTTEANFNKTGKIAKNDFSSYVVGISQLGWINCDRFRQFDRRTTLTIAHADAETKYYMIFKDIRSILRPKQLGRTAIFKEIPVGEKVKLVAVKLYNEKPYLATIDHEIGMNDEVIFDFKPCSLQQIREELNSLDPLFKDKKQEQLYDLSISMFPNPASSEFSVQAEPKELLSGLSMYDLNGRLVKSINEDSQLTGRVSVSDIDSGTYVVNAVFSNGQMASERIVVQH